MPNPEDFKGAKPAAAKTDDVANSRLYDGAYIKRSGDNDSTPFVQIHPKKPADQPAPKVADQPAKTPAQPAQNGGAADWRLTPNDVRMPSAAWHDPSKTQWNGKKQDVSRTESGTYFQKRPGFVGTPENPATTLHNRPGVIGPPADPLKSLPVVRELPPYRPEIPVQPIVTVPAETKQLTMPTDAAGRQVGPVIITGAGDLKPAAPVKSPGFMIDQNIEKNIKEERAENQSGISAMYAAGFVGGCLIGVKRGGIRGAAVGAVIGVAATFGAKRLFE